MKTFKREYSSSFAKAKKQPTSKILTITGYYGAGNLGDDLMLHCFVKSLLNNTDCKLNVFQFNHTSPISLEPHERIKIIKIPKKGIGRLVTVAKNLRRSNWLIFGGGTCFTDSSGDGSFKLFMLAKLLGCHLAYIGVGIGSLSYRSRIWKTKVLLHFSDIITFRDNRSYDYGLAIAGKALNKKIYKTEDLCYLDIDYQLSKIVPKTKTAKPLWVISVRPLGQYLSEEKLYRFWHNWIEWLCDLIEKNKPVKIIFLVIDDQRDIPISEKICNSLRERNLHYNNFQINVIKSITADEKCMVLASADHIIAMRLHSILLGCAMKVPTFGVSYCKKISSFYQSIGSDYFAEIDDWLCPAGRPAISIPIHTHSTHYNLKNAKKKALMNIDILKSYL